MADQEVFEEIRADFREALPALTLEVGHYDPKEHLQPLWRVDNSTWRQGGGLSRGSKDRAILSAVMAVYGVSRAEMYSRVREEVALEARHMAYYVMHRHGSQSVAQIGRFMDRDHSTISHTVDKMTMELQRYEIAQRYKRICRELGVMED